MDFVDIIIWVAILAVGGLLSGGKKKKPGQQPAARPVASNTQNPQMSNNPQPRSSQSVNRRNTRSQRSSYFTYEDLSSESNTPSNDNKHATVNESSNMEEYVTVSEPFNLRQAIIYDTILKNEYISEMNQNY